MIGRLRTPFFIIALVAAALVVLAEVGSPWLVKGVAPSRDAQMKTMRSVAPDAVGDLKEADLPKGGRPPGKAIGHMALVDGQVLFVVGLMGLSLVVTKPVHGRVQGVALLAFAILMILCSILLALAGLVLLMIMVALFLAAPFGTMAYLAKWGSFDTGGAAALLSLIMTLKLCAAIMLVLAHQQFLKSKLLIFLVLVSLVCNIIIAFLHAMVPSVLVSITDLVGAIVMAIIAVILGIIFAVYGVVSIKRVII